MQGDTGVINGTSTDEACVNNGSSIDETGPTISFGNGTSNNEAADDGYIHNIDAELDRQLRIKCVGISSAMTTILENGSSPDHAVKPLDLSDVAVIHPSTPKLPDNAKF